MNSKTVSRRRHGADLKAQVLRECERPGASVAGIALAHGLNANLVHKWRHQARAGSGLACAPAEPAHFIALPLAPTPVGPTPPAQADIRIELHRAALAVHVVWPVATRVAAMIRIDTTWLATAPLDVRAGTDTALARVVAAFGAAHPHTAYLFANKHANRIKILVHDGIGIWLAARRLHQGKFIWPSTQSANCGLECAQLDALVLGLPWQRMGQASIITVV